jgi:hypothetical protein
MSAYHECGMVGAPRDGETDCQLSGLSGHFITGNAAVHQTWNFRLTYYFNWANLTIHGERE